MVRCPTAVWIMPKMGVLNQETLKNGMACSLEDENDKHRVNFSQQ